MWGLTRPMCPSPPRLDSHAWCHPGSRSVGLPGARPPTRSKGQGAGACQAGERPRQHSLGLHRPWTEAKAWKHESVTRALVFDNLIS